MAPGLDGASVSVLSATRDAGTERRTARTVDRIGHGVFVLLTTVLTTIWLVHWAATGPLAWLVGAMIVVVVVRVSGGRADGRDLLLLALALAVTLWFGYRHDVFDRGVGADATPAFPVFVVAMMFPPTVLRRRMLPVGVVIGVYVVGKVGVGGLGPFRTVDEVIAVGTAGVMLALLVDAFRAAADVADGARADARTSRLVVARQAAAQRIAEQRRRLLHDQVLSVLTMVERAGYVDQDEWVRRSCGEQAAALRGRDDRRPPSELEDVLADEYSRRFGVRLTADIDPAFDPEGVPDEVIAALVGAIGEAVRNVGRHAGVDEAQLVVRGDARSVQVEVRDRGAGFVGGMTEGFGIQRSIRGRLAEVGGEVEITSAPGAGTQVLMRWDAGVQRRYRIPRLRRAIQTHELLSRNGNLRSRLAAMAVAAMLGPLWMAIRYPAPEGRAPLALMLAVALAALFAVVPRWAAAGLLPLRRHLVFQALLTAALGVGLLLAGPGALLGFRSWVVGMVTFLMMFLAFSAPLVRTVAFGLSMSCAVTLAAVLDPTISPLDVLSPVTQPVLFTGLAALAVFGIGSGLAGVRADEEEVAQGFAELALAEARANTFDEHFALLALPLADFLEDLAAGRVSLHDPESRARARSFALEARDDLYLPGVLEPDTRQRLREVRRAGGTVTIRRFEPTPAVTEAVNDLVRLLVGALRGAPAATISAVPPVPGAPGFVRGVLVGHLDSLRVAALQRWAAERGADVQNDAQATVVTVPVDSERVQRDVLPAMSSAMSSERGTPDSPASTVGSTP